MRLAVAMTTADGVTSSTAELDPYNCLGVGKTADAQALKKAYRALALELHPDKTHGDEAAAARFKEVTQAYNCLADPDKRRYYNKTGSLEGIDVTAEEWMTTFAEVMQEFTGGVPIKVRGAHAAAPLCPVTRRLCSDRRVDTSTLRIATLLCVGQQRWACSICDSGCKRAHLCQSLCGTCTSDNDIPAASRNDSTIKTRSKTSPYMRRTCCEAYQRAILRPCHPFRSHVSSSRLAPSRRACTSAAKASTACHRPWRRF